MIQYVFIPKRSDRESAKSKACYLGRYKLPGMDKVAEISLDTTDKRIADQRLGAYVRELQEEAAGIIKPRGIREGAAKPLAGHLDAFKADLRAKGRSAKYVENVGHWITRLQTECGWVYLRDVTAESFMAWRAKQAKAPKTLNEYFNATCALLNWLQRTGQSLANPLLSAGRVETRGKEKRVRRALTDAEVGRLLGVSASRRTVYLTALLTGLRRKELRSLQWGDVHLDAPQPFLSVRASTTKNRLVATIWLRDDLAGELRRCGQGTRGKGRGCFGLFR